MAFLNDRAFQRSHTTSSSTSSRFSPLLSRMATFLFPDAPGVMAKSTRSPEQTDRRLVRIARRSGVPIKAISHRLDAAIDFTIDRFSDSLAALADASTTMTRTSGVRPFSCPVRDCRHRRRGSGLSAVVTPTVVIGVLSSRRRSSETKIGKRVAQGLAGNPDDAFERTVEFQDQENRRRD